MADRWLKKLTNGTVWHWTPLLSKRDDMVEVDKTGKPLAFNEKADLYTFMLKIETLTRENETLKAKIKESENSLKTIEEMRLENDRLKMMLNRKEVDAIPEPEPELQPGEAAIESLEGTAVPPPESEIVPAADGSVVKMQPADTKNPMPKFNDKPISQLNNEDLILAAKELFGLDIDKSVGRIGRLKAIKEAHEAKTAKG